MLYYVDAELRGHRVNPPRCLSLSPTHRGSWRMGNQVGPTGCTERPESTGSKTMFFEFSLSSVAFFLSARSGFLHFFNLYGKSRPENQTKRGEIDLFRTFSKVLVYVLESFSLRFCSKRIDFRAILTNTMGTMGTPVDWALSVDRGCF